jgi:large subunit ribosomal protein L22
MGATEPGAGTRDAEDALYLVQEARAVARFVRAQPRKVRIVLDLIRGKPAGEALAILRFVPNRAARLVDSVLRSAIANATHNYDLDPDLLYVARATADQGPVAKRIHPRARGRAFPILKRTTHITVVVRQAGT